MKKTLFLLAMPIIFSAQIRTDVEVFDNSRGSVFDVQNIHFQSYDGIEGSPYIDDNFTKVKIENYDKPLPEVRYNAYEDEMEFMKSGQLNYIIKSGDMRFVLQNQEKIYVLKTYGVNDQTVNGYLVELVRNDEKYSLYKKEQVIILEDNNNIANRYMKAKKPEFIRSKDIFIILYNGQYFLAPKNTKDLKTIFAGNLNDAESYVKKEKLNLNKETDLKKLVNHLNNL